MPSYNLFNSPIMQAAWQDPVNAEFLRGTVQAGGAPQLQEALADEQAQANFNRDKANLAFMTEMANRGAYVGQQTPPYTQGLMTGLGTNEAPIQQAQEEAPQRVPLNQMARAYLEQGVRAKGLYDEAEKAGNTEAMALAHAGGEQARTALRQLGVDPAAYGMEGSYADAQQALAANDMQAMQNILQGEMAESSGQYYDRVYKILRDNGFSSDIAEAEAHRRAEAYASNRVQALNQAFNTYGHNGQVINPMGIQMLGMMAQEDMEMANYYTQRYAGPLQEYAKQNARENAAIQHKYKGEDRAEDQKNALERIGYQGQVNAHLKQIDAAQKEAYAKNRFVESVQLAGIKASINAATKGKNNNGYTQEQAKLAHDGIKEINRQLENNMNLSDTDKQELMNQRAQLQAIINAYEGIGQKGNGSVLSGVDVNNYNSLLEAYQEIAKRNAAAYDKNDPNDPPMSWDELNRAFLKEAGEDNPMALNIIENSQYKTGSSSSGAASTSAPARPSAPQVVYLPATESGDNPGGYADDTGTRGNIPIVGLLKDFSSNIAQSLRDKPLQTRAGLEAASRYRRE